MRKIIWKGKPDYTPMGKECVPFMAVESSIAEVIIGWSRYYKDEPQDCIGAIQIETYFPEDQIDGLIEALKKHKESL